MKINGVISHDETVELILNNGLTTPKFVKAWKYAERKKAQEAKSNKINSK